MPTLWAPINQNAFEHASHPTTSIHAASQSVTQINSQLQIFVQRLLRN